MDKFLNSNGLQLCYQDMPAKHDFSNSASSSTAGGNTILLIAGLGEQLGEWPFEFCQLLCKQGYRVIRYDNRDIGLSSKVSERYSLDDMADDAAGLLDALDISASHIIGMSMGGMIAQLLCSNHPNRALSLCSIMSSSGNPSLPPPTPEALTMLTKKSAESVESFIDNWVAGKLIIDSPAYPANERRLHERAQTNCKRSYHPEGYLRHLTAIFANGSRVQQLQKIDCPTLVIHGKNDPLVPYQSGVDTAKHINGAQLLLIDGMGHNLPQPLFAELTAAIVKNLKRCENRPKVSIRS